jgi:hypothetical protein
VGVHGALLAAVRTGNFGGRGGRDFARPVGLDQPAQALPDSMSWQFNLVKVRNAGTLVHGLQLSRDFRRLVQQIFQLFFQLSPFRVHAIFLSITSLSLPKPAIDVSYHRKPEFSY